MSTIQITPQGGYAPAREFFFTGQDMDNSTAHAADLAAGAILQAAAGSSLAGNIQAANWPTVGYNMPFCVVDEDILGFDLATMNTLDGVTANKRTGGKVKGIISGYCRARVKANVTSMVTRLVPMTGQNYLVPFVGNGLVGNGLVAASTAVTNTVTTEQTFTGASVTIPADSLKVGDVISGVCQGVVSASASTDTLTVKIKIGTNVIALTASPDVATGDVFVVMWSIKVRTVGASGTAVTAALHFIGTPSLVAAATDIPSGSALASFTLDTTAATTISASGTWSATNATCTANVEIFDVRVDRSQASFGSNAFAVAMETVDNSAAAALTKILVLQPLF